MIVISKPAGADRNTISPQDFAGLLETVGQQSHDAFRSGTEASLGSREEPVHHDA